MSLIKVTDAKRKCSEEGENSPWHNTTEALASAHRVKVRGREVILFLCMLLPPLPSFQKSFSSRETSCGHCRWAQQLYLTTLHSVSVHSKVNRCVCVCVYVCLFIRVCNHLCNCGSILCVSEAFGNYERLVICVEIIQLVIFHTNNPTYFSLSAGACLGCGQG